MSLVQLPVSPLCWAQVQPLVGLLRRLVEMLPGWHPRCGIVHAIFPSRRGLLPSVRSLIDHLAEEFAISDKA